MGSDKRTQITCLNDSRQPGDHRDQPDLTASDVDAKRRAKRLRRPEAWPRRMRQDVAAEYLGITRSCFLQRVADKIYPDAAWEDGAPFWDRYELDDYLDHNRLDTEVEADDPWAKAK